MTRRAKKEYVIHSLDHTLDVLEAFSQHHSELGLSQISRLIGLHKNSVFRLMATLENRGYVEKNPLTGNYRLGLKAFEAGYAYLRHTTLTAAARPFLVSLAVELHENAYLAIMRDDYVFFLDEASSEQIIRVTSRLGTRVAPCCTATGRVFLAWMEPAALEEVLKRPLEAETPRTITDPASLRRELSRVRERGYALDQEEWEEGVHCVAAPIFDYYGKMAGTISVTGPAYRMDAARLEKEVIPAVTGAAREISRKMGYLVGQKVRVP